MGDDPFLTIDDDSFYSILTAFNDTEFDEKMEDVLMAAELYTLYGAEREKVFLEALTFFQKKYHLPNIELQPLFLIAKTPADKLEDDDGILVNDDKALLSLEYGDFPEFINALYIFDDKDFILKAIRLGREESAIAQDDKLDGGGIDRSDILTESLKYGCKKCIEHVFQHIEVHGEVVHWKDFIFYEPTDVNLQNPQYEKVEVNGKLLDYYIESGKDLDQFWAYLQQAPDKEVMKSRRRYRKKPNQDERVVRLFKRRLF